ncbi:MAG: hypothetical protein WC378_00940 [Opitutaceae bacterium]|jgi:hypothetical protein
MSPDQLRRFSNQTYRATAKLFGSTQDEEDSTRPNVRFPTGEELRVPWSSMTMSRTYQPEGFVEGAEAVATILASDFTTLPSISSSLVYLPTQETFYVIQTRPAAAAPGQIKLALSRQRL